MQRIKRHIRFYCSLLFGAAVFVAARLFGLPAPLLAGGDAFFLVFLLLMAPLVAVQSDKHLRERARNEDEGIVIVILVTLAALSFFTEAVFSAINGRHGIELLPVALSGAGALLGWFVLHTVVAFHYADLHYFADPGTEGHVHDLKFPHTARPGPWDFLYFSFVIGMTAQVSDVQVQTTSMRRAVLAHGIVSFFFNTVFIAMAVNAAVAMAA